MTVSTLSIAQALAEATGCIGQLELTPIWSRKSVQAPARSLRDHALKFAALRGYGGLEAAERAGEAFTALMEAVGTRPLATSEGREVIARLTGLFGSEQSWQARVTLAYTPELPDASLHDPDVLYLRGLIEVIGLSQREVANRIGIGYRLLKYYLVTPTEDKESRVATYTVQYAIERLAASRVMDAGKYTDRP